MQNAIKTGMEASAGTASAFVAGGVLSSKECDIPTFSDYPIWSGTQYIFTADNLLQVIAGVATIVTIAYFINKFRA